MSIQQKYMHRMICLLRILIFFCILQLESTSEIMDKGISCLLDNLGTVETERFISVIIREQFDYTKWRRQYHLVQKPAYTTTDF